MNAEPEQLDVLIEDLDKRLERLKAMYEQYFMGIEKLEPLILRKEVDRRFWMLRKRRVNNTALRFRLNSLTQRYNAYQQYWRRILREIEAGTYKRHLQKATKRFGASAEQLAKKGTVSAEELEKQRLEREEKAKRMLEEVPDLDSFDIDVSFDLDEDTAYEDRHETSTDNMPLDFDITSPSHGYRAFDELMGNSSSKHLDTAEVFQEDDDDITQPHQIPAFLRDSEPAARPVPPPPRPPIPTRAKPPAAPARPRAGSEHNDKHRTATAPVPRPRPSARPAAPTPKRSRPNSPPTPANTRRPTASAAPRPAVPAPTRRAAPPPRPVEPQSKSRSTNTNPRPTPERPTARRSIARKPPQAAPAPSTAKPAEVRRRSTNQEARNADRSPPHAGGSATKQGLSSERVRDIYQKYVTARRQCNESTSTITERSLAKSLEKSAEKLRKKHGKDVDFEVVIHKGKAVIKPKIR